MSSSIFPIDILWPALIAGLLVLATHVPLGFEVLRRGIIFIDLAIAQVAGLGVIAAHGFAWEPNGWEVQAVAVSSALFAAVALNWIEKKWPDIQEPVIGALFVLAASLGIILLSSNPQGGEHLKDLLVGQILWVDAGKLLPTGVVYAAILFFWFVTPGIRTNFGFYIVFAIAVTVSVQMVGVYLVFASLIIPALSARVLNGRARLLFAYAIGGLGYLAGLIFSAVKDVPTGAAIVTTLIACAVIFSMGKSLLSRSRF